MKHIDDMQFRHALAEVEPGSKLEQVLARWSGYRPTVKTGNTYLMQGYIDILRSVHEIAAAIDESIDPRLPAHCFDPKEVALFFNVPVEELVLGSEEDSGTSDGSKLARIAEAIERIAEHIVPEPQAIVGTDYIAERLGCTQTWITDQTRRGEIPKSCCVEGTGNGKPWKYHRKKIDSWIRSR